MNRQKAILIHAGIGSALLLILLAVVFYLWYPAPYFNIAGNKRVLYVLAGICLLGAPLLTWVVFKPGKKGLVFDLWVIAALQAAALGFNTWVLWSQKPAYMVFAVDRFNLLPAGQVDGQSIIDPRFLDVPLRGPLLLVATMPTDPAEYQKLLQETFFEGKEDIHWRSEYWTLYSEDYLQAVHRAASAHLLSDAHADYRQAISAVFDSSGLAEDELLFVPVTGREKDHAVLIRKSDGSVVDAIALKTGESYF